MQVEFVNGSLTVRFVGAQEERLLAEAARERAAADAEQAALGQVYDVAGLCARLQISRTTAHELITGGTLTYTCCGKKGYRFTEYHVRRFLGIPVPPLP